jgi:nucleoside-diphosphate-sugar epimerase
MTSASTMLLDDLPFPERFDNEQALEDYLAVPSRDLVRDLARIDGDLMILGVGGKMGPTLARLARNAMPKERRVIAVARFSEPGVRESLQAHGIETISCDLLDREAVAKLPQCPNIVFMAGRKFGAEGNTPLTWAMNAYVPAIVADTFRQSRIVAFSTACVYPFVPVISQGASESEHSLTPPGEYANSCVGRERMFEHFSQQHGTPGRLFRLSYAIDMRYGVLADVAAKVWKGEPVDVTMGHVNVIWQGDANSQALRCLAAATVPTSPLNVSGPETTSIRWLAEEFARRFDKPATITGAEAPTAWLMNTSQAERLFGYPRVPLLRLVDWVADWISREQRLLGKPTKFENRDGKY